MRNGVRKAVWCAATLGVLSLTFGFSGPVGAEAQPGEPAGFIPGEGSAIASTVGITIDKGGEPVGFGYGRPEAKYTNREFTGLGVALDLGLLNTLFGAALACNPTPLIPNSNLPPDTQAKTSAPVTTNPGAQAFMPQANGKLGQLIGTQDAAVAGGAASAATTTTYQDFGFISLSGAKAEATTSLVNGVRQATAAITGSQLKVLGGAITLVEPRWEAVSRTGGETAQTGGFTFKKAYLFGQLRTPEQLGKDFSSLAKGIGDLLKGLGFQLTFPEVKIDGTQVEVTPMSFAISNPPLGKDVIGPILNDIQLLIDAAKARDIEKDCNNESVWSLGELFLKVLHGEATVKVAIGGVRVMTAATVFPSVAIDVPVLDEPTAVPVEIPTTTTTAAPFVVPPAVGGTSSFKALDTSVSVDPVPTELAEVPAATLPVDSAPPPTEPSTTADASALLPSLPTSTSRFVKGSTGGSAALVALLGLGGVLLLAAADRHVMNRGNRKIAES